MSDAGKLGDKMPLNLSRSLLTIILPGIVATAPWLLLLITEAPDLQHWYTLHVFPVHVAAFAIAVTAGALFEGIGCYFELHWDRAKANEDVPTVSGDWVSRDWYAYLTRSFGSAEPVAYRYLSRKVTALYFEMGMMQAIPIGLVGLGALTQKLFPEKSATLLFSVGVAFVVFFVFLKFARDTHTVLCETRYFLNDATVDDAALLS